MNRKPDVRREERAEVERALAYAQSEPHVLSVTLCTGAGRVEVYRDGRITLRSPPPNQEDSPT